MENLSFYRLVEGRRSVRKFEQREVSADVVEKILAMTLTAPSSKNSRTTRIAVTADRSTLAALAAMRSTGSAFLRDAPMAFIVMGDDSQTDLWRENASISATVLQFAAESLGLGTCWVQVFGRPRSNENPDGETAEEYLHMALPALPRFRILCAVAAGYPADRPAPHKMKVEGDKVFRV